MKTYMQLSREERRIMGVLLEEGKSMRRVAQALGRSHSMLSRELKRRLSLRTKGKCLLGIQKKHLAPSIGKHT